MIRQSDPPLHEAVFRLEGEDAPGIMAAIRPEIGDEPWSRTTIAAWLEGERTLVIHISAKDISALRAALNMWLRLINVAHEMQEIA